MKLKWDNKNLLLVKPDRKDTLLQLVPDMLGKGVGDTITYYAHTYYHFKNVLPVATDTGETDLYKAQCKALNMVIAQYFALQYSLQTMHSDPESRLRWYDDRLTWDRYGIATHYNDLTEVIYLTGNQHVPVGDISTYWANYNDIARGFDKYNTRVIGLGQAKILAVDNLIACLSDAIKHLRDCLAFIQKQHRKGNKAPVAEGGNEA
jgi:hypothetical protein